MGQEITRSHFTEQDFKQFGLRLQEETDTLESWFREDRFSDHKPVAGYEMEAWLIDEKGRPQPRNEDFLAAASNPLYTAELAQFNIEINTLPAVINSRFLSEFENSFQQHWQACQQAAESIGCRLLATGILPTLQDSDLNMHNVSRLLRYQALNEQVLLQRQGRALQLNINGHQSLKSRHHNVMLEAATTSLQIHLQVPQERAHHYYNGAILISAPMVAISANSPFMFARDLWAESRIPVFEQAVDVGGYNGAAQGPLHRVSFGSGYARHSLLECFTENLQHFPVLLPMGFDDNPAAMKHLGLHNGTIWRWNRPLIGFDEDGRPHLRIEHRVMPAGPSVVDNIANMAFYFGLVEYYANHEVPPHEQLPFSQARDNFYRSAQHGLETRLDWPGREHGDMRHLILDHLLIHAETGLRHLQLEPSDIEYYLGIIQARAEQQQTGSHWQRQFVEKQGADMQQLVQTYYRNQQTGEPVHCWDFSST